MLELNRPLSAKHLEQLAKLREANCVSIYIPMFKTGQEQNQGLGQAYLKSCLKSARLMLSERGMDRNKIEKYLKPVEELISEIQLWRHPSEGMAIFVNDTFGAEYYLVPLALESETYVSDHHYLVPLMPLYEFDTTFYLLELSQDYVKLYKGSRYSMEDMFVNEFAPERLEESVGFDYKQKMLQFRTGHALHSAGSFHGHGEGKDDDEKEVVKFFREIDRGVNKAIDRRSAPLIVACVDWLFPVYKEVNTYSGLQHIHISGDPEFKNKMNLHRKVWNGIKDIFREKKNQLNERYHELVHTPKTSHQVSEIVPAAFNGKIDTLFLKKGEHLYGTYNRKNNCVIIDSEKTRGNASLINMAALNTFLQGGRVITMEPSEMPEKKRPLNAMFRY